MDNCSLHYSTITGCAFASHLSTDLISHLFELLQKTIEKPLSLAEFKKIRKSPRNINQEFACKMSRLDRLAVFVTDKIGTVGFFLLILGWTVIWLGWNLFAPLNLRFDPAPGFILWLFISNLIQIMLMPLIMDGQNIQGKYAEIRAENDLEINIKAEQEIEIILNHLEYQNQILIAMVEKLNIDSRDFYKL